MGGRRRHAPSKVVDDESLPINMEQVEMLRAKVNEVREVPSPADSPLLRDVLKDVARQAATATLKALEAQRVEDELTRTEGGPCRYCGARHSPVWRGNGFDMTCDACEYEFGFDQTDAERRIRALRTLFTPRELQGWVGHALADRAGFEWFHEAKAVATYGERWQYVTDVMRRSIVARLAPESGPPLHDEYCSRCGCDGAWEWTLPHATVKPGRAGLDIDGNPTSLHPDVLEYEGLGWRCTACAGVSVEDAAATLVPALEGRLKGRNKDHSGCNGAGVVWFAQTDARTRKGHDPTRPYSWLTPDRIARHVKG